MDIMSKSQERKIPNVIVVSVLKGGAAERRRGTGTQQVRCSLLTRRESSFLNDFIDHLTKCTIR